MRTTEHENKRTREQENKRTREQEALIIDDGEKRTDRIDDVERTDDNEMIQFSHELYRHADSRPPMCATSGIWSELRYLWAGHDTQELSFSGALTSDADTRIRYIS